MEVKHKIIIYKITLLMILILLSILVLCGCENENSESTSSPKNEPTSFATETAAPSPTPYMSKSEYADKAVGGGNTLSANVENSEYGRILSLHITSEENPGVDFEIEAVKNTQNKTYCFYLPCRANQKDITFFAKHKTGAITGPYTVDFTDENYENETLDNYKVTVNPEYGSLAQVHASADHSVYTYGDMILTVTDELAAKNGWQIKYASSEFEPDSYGTMRIRGCGNASWGYSDKRPYQLRTENKLDLLGMGEAKTWILLANVLDSTMLRNNIFLNLSQDMGLQQIDLFIDGEYRGMYSLTTKVEVKEN